jgi:hypothetical protein
MNDLEIVGLSSSSSGRNCQDHDVCGEHLCNGDICRLVRCNVLIQGIAEESIKVVKVVDGSDKCMVAFVPRSFQSMERIYSHIGGLIVINEIYKDSPNPYKQRMATNNKGMASASLLFEEIDSIYRNGTGNDDVTAMT